MPCSPLVAINKSQLQLHVNSPLGIAGENILTKEYIYNIYYLKRHWLVNKDQKVPERVSTV